VGILLVLDFLAQRSSRPAWRGTAARAAWLLALWFAVNVFGCADAGACSCAGWPVRPILGSVPADESTGVPTDAVVRVFVGASAELPELVRSGVRIVGPDRRVVPAHVTAEPGMVTVRPRAPLLAHTDYTVERAVLYRDGLQQRESSAYSQAFADLRRGRTPVREGWEQVWYPASTFRTDEGPDRRVTQPPVLNAATLTAGDDLCGEGEALSVEIGLASPLGPTDLLMLEVGGLPGSGMVMAGPFAFRTEDTTIRRIVGDRGCGSTHLQTDARGALYVRPVLLTGSGRSVPADGWTTVMISPSTWIHDHPRTEHDAPMFWDALTWAKGIPFADPRPPPLGPPACPFGFQVGERRVLVDEEWPPSYLFPADPLGRAAGVVATRPPTWGTILRRWTLRTYERGGDAEWQVNVGRRAAPLFAAASPSRVLIAWRSFDREKRWALFDRTNGDRFDGVFPPEWRSGVRAIPQTDGGFVVFGSGVRAVSSTRIAPDGRMSPLAVLRGPVLEDSSGAAYIIVDGTTLVRLGSDLNEEGTPIQLLAGEPHAIAAWRELVAIVSVSRRGGDGRQEAWVTVADWQTGAVAPDALVNRGRPVFAPFVAPTVDGLVLLYGVAATEVGLANSDRVVPVVEELVCTAEPPRHAPKRLAPLPTTP
jgi:hypothetical protein